MSVHGFQIDAGTLAAIWAEHGLGPVRHSEWLTRGRNNPALVVNGDRVIRFDGLLDRDEHRFLGEAQCYRLLAEAGIPAPQVYAAVTDSPHVGRDYLILSRVPGDPLIERWPHLSAAQQRAAAEEAGQLLARLHAIPAPGTGYGMLTKAIYPTWWVYQQAWVSAFCEAARAEGWLDEAQIADILALTAAFRPTFEAVTARQLVHRDFHFENLLFHDGHISAVLDFEWALAGDPVCDFRIEEQWARECPGSREALLAGYTALSPLTADHERRRRFYRLTMRMEYVEDALDEAELREAVERLMEGVDETR